MDELFTKFELSAFIVADLLLLTLTVYAGNAAEMREGKVRFYR